MYNYWTEGGFIAYGQTPDPETGRTPLQLYMDGRAQAAYNTNAYERWMYIMGGGEPARRIERAGRTFTNSDYADIGQWIDKQLKSENVGVALMPAAQFDSVFMKGLVSSPSWRIVYMDTEQQLCVDITTEQGKELYTGIFNGKTKFPDDESRFLTIGYNLSLFQDDEKAGTGCEFLMQAFAKKPSQVALIELMHALNRRPQSREQAVKVMSQYFDDFIAKRETYKKEDGYRDKLISALLIADYFSKVNRQQKSLVDKYKSYIAEFSNDQLYMNKTSRW